MLELPFSLCFFARFGVPRSVHRPIWMKVPYYIICRSGRSGWDGGGGNEAVKALNLRTGKLCQLSLVKLVIAVNLSKVTKPVILLEATATRRARAIRGRMTLRVSQRMCMNVGDPNGMVKPP